MSLTNLRHKPEVYAAGISLFASVIITSIKFLGYNLTHSNAIFSDALESIVNVVAAGFALIVMKFISEPADEEHPYGHGKMEYFSAAFEGGLIAFAALVIIFESTHALFTGEGLKSLDSGLWFITIAAVMNLFLSIYLNKAGKTYHSEALKASAAHVLTDVWTTIGVIVGLLLVKVTNLTWIDPTVAILVGLHLAYSGVLIVKRSVNGLIDATDFTALEHLAKALNENKKPGLIDVHNIRIIRSGRFHHVDAHLVVPDYWDVVKTHNIASEFEKSVVAAYPFDGEFAFHIDPCQSEYCSRCDMPDSCPIRKRPTTTKMVMTAQSIIKGPTKDVP